MKHGGAGSVVSILRALAWGWGLASLGRSALNEGAYAVLDDAHASDASDHESTDDSSLPGDGIPDRVARPSNCGDAGTSYIYVVTQQGELFSFDPPSAGFDSIGVLAYPGASGTPFSMAVDRQGIAYVIFSSGQLFRVSTLAANCSPTPFAMQQGFTTFGMSFLNRGGPADTLYVATDGVPRHGRVQAPSRRLTSRSSPSRWSARCRLTSPS